jgi:hypothetical protein
MQADGMCICMPLIAGVEEVDLLMEKENPVLNRGFGFVVFYNYAAADLARKQLTEHEFK